MSSPAELDLEAAFAEAMDAAVEILDLPDAARAEVWVSSILAIWREPGCGADPEAADRAFLDHLTAHPGPAASALAAAISGLGPSALADQAAGVVSASEAAAPVWADAVGTAEAIGASRARVEGRGECLMIEFVHADGFTHTLLADLGDGCLAGLHFGPAMAELLGGEDPEEARRISAVAVDPVVAAGEIAEAWRQTPTAMEVELDDETLMNEVVARARLTGLLGAGTELPSLAPSGAGGIRRDLAPRDIEADQAAALTLVAALGAPAEGDPAAADAVTGVADLLIPESIATRPRSEQDALLSLEWADWLGAVIGLVRAGAGTPVDGPALVDHVNRCPEVTSSIARRDRPYYEWAFGVLAALLVEHGLVRDGHLAPGAPPVLHAALFQAWTRP